MPALHQVAQVEADQGDQRQKEQTVVAGAALCTAALLFSVGRAPAAAATSSFQVKQFAVHYLQIKRREKERLISKQTKIHFLSILPWGQWAASWPSPADTRRWGRDRRQWADWGPNSGCADYGEPLPIGFDGLGASATKKMKKKNEKWLVKMGRVKETTKK